MPTKQEEPALKRQSSFTQRVTKGITRFVSEHEAAVRIIGDGAAIVTGLFIPPAGAALATATESLIAYSNHAVKKKEEEAKNEANDGEKDSTEKKVPEERFCSKVWENNKGKEIIGDDKQNQVETHNFRDAVQESRESQGRGR